jgi:hypothetical protein
MPTKGQRYLQELHEEVTQYFTKEGDYWIRNETERGLKIIRRRALMIRNFREKFLRGGGNLIEVLEDES